MKAQDETDRESPQGAAQPHPTGSIVAQAALASAVLIGVIAVSLHVGSGGASWPLHSAGDAVSKADADLRASQFATLAPLPLALVPASENAVALDGMRLEPAAKAALAESIAPRPSAAVATLNSGRAPSDVSPASAGPEPLRLAWVTLWDTDAEDGDVVRLDSAGYSRTVTLAKKPVTFAVPVPPEGIIRVTGIRDGEGGGITVGLASGASQAVFPIMSVGQTLGLKVSFER